MKNSLKSYLSLLIFILPFLTFVHSVFADDILIDAKEVDIKDKGNLIVASGTVKITDGLQLEINGDNAVYDKSKQILEITGDVSFIDKENNYEVESDRILFNRLNNTVYSLDNTLINVLNNNGIPILKVKSKNSFFKQSSKTLEINKEVILKDVMNDYEIFSEKIFYNQDKGIIKSFDDTKINYKDDYLIISNEIIYDNNKKTLSSKNATQIIDNNDNKIILSNFNLDLSKKILKGEQMALVDNEENNFELSKGFINLETNEVIGSDFVLKLNKNTFGNIENDPRFLGKSLINNKNETIVKKGTFTTCKNVEGKCPAWSISADEIKLEKNKKRIEYKNAWIELYNMPVAYFPYFFHPDPSVERQSGFLFPQFINSSNLGFSTQIPYFKAIDIDRDITLSPRVYSNNNLFIQSEYRQVFKNSKLITDLSLNKKDSTSTHFFGSLLGEFENSFYEMKIQTVSNKDYLKKYQISSPLISDRGVLNSFLYYEKNTDNYNFSTNFNIIEDLSKSKSDRYEYEFPNYKLTKEIYSKNNFFNEFHLNSQGNYKKFNTNVDEAEIVNDFIFIQNKEDISRNLQTDLSFLVRNINTYGNLSDKYKDKDDYRFINSFLLNLKYPLFKKLENSESYLTPIASLRYSPNKGLNLKNEKQILRYEDLFQLDRINNKTTESGGSITVGMEYKNIEKNNDNIQLGIGINFRENEDNDIPDSLSLGQKTSDIIGYSGINITDNLSFKYNFSIDQNLSGTNYSLISLNYNHNLFKTSFEYMEKSQNIGDESYLKNYTELVVDKRNSLVFETNRNIDKNLTDYYDLIYKYKNDCLEASIVYNKQFYNEESINSEKNIFFKISFIPFGTVNTPNLND